jgi:hypothetical protein
MIQAIPILDSQEYLGMPLITETTVIRVDPLIEETVIITLQIRLCKETLMYSVAR